MAGLEEGLKYTVDMVLSFVRGAWTFDSLFDRVWRGRGGAEPEFPAKHPQPLSGS